MTETITRNGVDVATLFATLDAVKAAPDAARFQFRASNQWVSGTHSRGTIHGFFGVGEERTHEHVFQFDADHPAVLVGRDNGPTPVEYVLHALAACLTAGLANIAAARGVRLTAVTSTVGLSWTVPQSAMVAAPVDAHEASAAIAATHASMVGWSGPPSMVLFSTPWRHWS